MKDETGSPTDRAKLLSDIRFRDKEVFEAYTGTSFQKLPQNADQYRYLIPEPLWDFVTDPKKLKVVIDYHAGGFLTFFILEATDHPLTNIESLERFKELLFSSGKEKPKEFPPDIDPLHWNYLDEVENKTIKLTDKILLTASLNAMEDELYVASFGDREELRRKGIATNFYEHLGQFAKKLGFRYITGENFDDNVDFFRNKLGRVDFDRLPQDLQEHFEAHHGGKDFVEEDLHFTVGFINPEDKHRIEQD